MKKALFIIVLVFIAIPSFAQTSTDSVKQTVKTMFDGMRKGDSTLFKSALAPGMILQSISDGKDGKAVISTESVADFLAVIAKPHAQVYDERIVFDAVKIDGSLASVWAPYKFYLGDKFSHCGVDVFQLMRAATGWKIIYIVDTRRKGNCAD